MSNDIYGAGTWKHYFSAYNQYLGTPGLIIAGLGKISVLIVVIRKQFSRIQVVPSLFGIAVYLGIIGAHSYFWATGQNGSLGLTRVATQGMPLFLIISIAYISQLQFSQNKYFSASSILITVTLLIVSIPLNSIQIKAKNLDLSIHQTAEFLKSKPHRIQYDHPLLAFALNENPFDETESNLIRNESELALSKQLQSSFQPGDLLVRDSYYSREGNVLTLNAIEREESLVLIEEFPSEYQYADPENGVEGVRIYQYLPDSSSRIPIGNTNKILKQNEVIEIKSTDEFIGIIDTICEGINYFQTSLTST
ncbi:MAG: hypothetical protein MK105_03100 [Crocinitomicaceae bacterium]|nr:hypothetical protein [Crocinitomicaceae bacterium]